MVALRGGAAASLLASSGVQKILELSVIAALGASLRGTLDPAGVTKLLLSALVPAVILSSLSTIKVSAALGGVLASGVGLLLWQQVAGVLVSRALVRGDDSRRRALRRTAAVQLATMAPAVSVLSFTREFAGAELVGLAALADVPTKAYHLLLLPTVARLRGDALGRKLARETEECVIEESSAQCAERRVKRLALAVREPFNAAILGGLALALCGVPTSELGFFGKAVGQLTAAQTPLVPASQTTYEWGSAVETSYESGWCLGP